MIAKLLTLLEFDLEFVREFDLEFDLEFDHDFDILTGIPPPRFLSHSAFHSMLLCVEHYDYARWQWFILLCVKIYWSLTFFLMISLPNYGMKLCSTMAQTHTLFQFFISPCLKA